MSRLRKFIEWEWEGHKWKSGESIGIFGDRFGKRMHVMETRFLVFDSYPIILPINAPGWIQLQINTTRVFGQETDWDGIPTEFLHELRGVKEENKYFGTPLYVLPGQYYEWIFKFGGEVIEEMCLGQEKKFRVLFADEEPYIIKKKIKSVVDINRIKILIPYMQHDGTDAILCTRLLEKGQIINNENLDKGY